MGPPAESSVSLQQAPVRGITRRRTDVYYELRA